MQQNTVNESFQNATGVIPYGMTNDYMFRAILQKNKRVLKGLICSLLHLDPQDVKSVEITNPIQLGDNIDDKEFVLDIHVLMNDNTIINLEMQVTNERNWLDRSLGYLCRAFDQLRHGQNYSEAKPVFHIGFLDFTPFPDSPEFYSTYKLLNVKNHRKYSDKFALSVVDLTQIELATEEDKASQIDYWARLFKATTWEEIRMIAKDNEYLKEASETLYELNADQMIQERCYARRCFMVNQNITNQEMERLTAENAALNREKEAWTEEKEAWTEEKEAWTEEKEAWSEEREALTAKIKALEEQNAALAAEKKARPE